MNKSKPSKTTGQTILFFVIGVMMIGGPGATLCSAEPISDASPAQTNSAPSQANFALSQTNSAPPQTNSMELKAGSPDTKKVVVKKEITGAELYSINCNRCHQERYPTERTGAQWKTIMLHMQVRANIPVSQAKLILQYLQENSGR